MLQQLRLHIPILALQLLQSGRHFPYHGCGHPLQHPRNQIPENDRKGGEPAQLRGQVPADQDYVQ
jgi:hypothetical protein